MSDDDDVQAKLALQAGKAVLKDATKQAKERVALASTSTKLKLLGGVVGIGVLGIVAVSLVAKLWAYAVVAVVLGGVGLAGYLVVKPKLTALRAKAEHKLLAGKREREELLRAEDARQAAAAAKQAADDAVTAKKQALEDQLAALKAKR